MEDLDITQTVKNQTTPVCIETPSTAIFPLHRIPPTDRPEPWEPRRLTRLASPIERTERPVETLQGAATNHYALGEDLGSDLPKVGQGPARRVVQLTLTAQKLLERDPLTHRGAPLKLIHNR
jgi:hypothetical protein